MWRDELVKLFLNKNIKFRQLADISELTSIKLGGKALVLAEPENEEQLIYTLRSARGLGAPFAVVGGMTNTLPTDDVFSGVIIRTVRIDSIEFTENNRVCAACGSSLASLVRGSADRGIGGFEEFVGIPGTVGGALFGNAGAHGSSISDRVVDVSVYDVIEDRRKLLSADDIKYGYRDSIFKHEARYLILSARLQGFAAEAESLKAKMTEYIKVRRQKQPLSMPSLGSIFKHPEGDFAPRLIESLGLKGLCIGGAEVSKVHAGFIVNNGTATSDDVKKVIEEVKKMVADKYGIDLKEEINYLV